MIAREAGTTLLKNYDTTAGFTENIDVVPDAVPAFLQIAKPLKHKAPSKK